MDNQTTIKVPKKYHGMVKEIYKDFEGYWVQANKGFIFSSTETHEVLAETQVQALKDIRSIVECDCVQCKQ